MDIIKHRNNWPFGDSTIIVLDNGYGVVKVTHENDSIDECTIIGLSVHKDKRGQGLGNRLLTEAENEAKEHYGVKTICLYCDIENDFVFSWYTRHGYKRDEHKIEFIIGCPTAVKLYKEL